MLGDWPDVTLEAISGNTLAHAPECSFCEGLLWAGEILRVIDAKSLAHESCYQGALTKAKAETPRAKRAKRKAGA